MSSATPGARTLVITLAAVPIVLGATLLIAVETARLVRPRAALFGAPAATSLAEAIDRGDLVQAHAMLRREPGALLFVSHPELTGGRATLVSPLLWAVATGNDDAVRLLLGMQHDLPQGTDRFAVCLAGALGHTGTVELLETYGRGSEAPCPALDTGLPPLLALAQQTR